MAKTLWFLKSAFILKEFLVSLKVSWWSCLCTPKLACNQGIILHLKMGHRSHHLCWLSRLLCCWRTAFSWCCLAYPWRWDRCLCLPVDNQGCAGGGKTQGNKFGCWAGALCLWLTFRVLTDRQTDRVYLSSCFISVSVQLLGSLGPWVLSCAVQSSLSVCVWCRQWAAILPEPPLALLQQ